MTSPQRHGQAAPHSRRPAGSGWPSRRRRASCDRREGVPGRRRGTRQPSVRAHWDPNRARPAARCASSRCRAAVREPRCRVAHQLPAKWPVRTTRRAGPESASPYHSCPIHGPSLTPAVAPSCLGAQHNPGQTESKPSRYRHLGRFRLCHPRSVPLSSSVARARPSGRRPRCCAAQTSSGERTRQWVPHHSDDSGVARGLSRRALVDLSEPLAVTEVRCAVSCHDPRGSVSAVVRTGGFSA